MPSNGVRSTVIKRSRPAKGERERIRFRSASPTVRPSRGGEGSKPTAGGLPASQIRPGSVHGTNERIDGKRLLDRSGSGAPWWTTRAAVLDRRISHSQSHTHTPTRTSCCLDRTHMSLSIASRPPAYSFPPVAFSYPSVTIYLPRRRLMLGLLSQFLGRRFPLPDQGN